MGEVYLAHDERLRRKVAIKLLPKLLVEDEERIRRFKHEARAASSISHQNVAHIYEIGEADGRLFTAMEFVDGLNLREWLAREDLELGQATDVATQVAAAIAAAHAQGVIHRDIKPENIMIRHDGLVKVVDFGLAKLTEPQRRSAQDSRETQMGARITRAVQTEPGMLLGTATYMSPEQARGLDIDARTDIWSWGVVFYEMLCGEPPFSGATNSDIIAEILKSEPSLLRSGIQGLPDTVTHILRRCLAKSKDGRYAESSDLVTELHELRQQLEKEGLLHLSVPVDESVFAATVETPRAQPSPGLLQESASQLPRSKAIATEPASSTLRGATTHGASTPGISKGRLSRALRRPILSSLLALGALSLIVGVLVLARSGLIFRKTATPTSSALEIIHLTNDGRVMDAAISPDARLLAFVPIESGKQSLRIRDLESGENWELLPPDQALCWGMRFSLNNQSLFYVMKQPGSTISVLYRMPVRGGPSQKLVVNIDSPPGLSPDGMQIAFIRSYPGQHRDALIVANVDGSAEREILLRQHPDRLCLSGVGWSPDGKLIAAGASRRDETEVAVLGVPTSGGAPIELTPWSWAAVRGVVWKNDGRTLLFSAQKPGSNALQIWRVSYPEKEIAPVTNDENEYEEATLAPNVLVATHTYEVSDLWATEQSNTSHRITTDGHNGADGLTVTSTGRIVYTVGEYAASQLWSMNLDGTDRRLLTKNYGVHPASSKDGQTIAYVSSEGGAHHIWLVNTDGQNNHQLTFGDGENYPSMTPDGEWVVYISRAKERGTLWKIPKTGGQSVQLTFAGIIVNPVVSPDGKMIACTYRTDEADRWKIAILPFDGGEPLKTFAVPSLSIKLFAGLPTVRLSLIWINKTARKTFGASRSMARRPLSLLTSMKT